MLQKNFIFQFLIQQLPSRKSIYHSIRTFVLILLGGLLLSPLLNAMPILGYDWYYFFNSGSPNHNIHSNLSFYPPFANLILSLLTWMDWRHSLAILNGITLTAIAIGTWNQGGKYFSIVLALFNAPVLFILWIGHPDGLTLVGLLTGFVPLLLMKPQVAVWSILSDRKYIFWTGVFLILSLIIWPFWFQNLQRATVISHPAFGWPVSGWPFAALGVILLLGAGKNPWRLMAAGTLITPYILPYHLAILSPAIGQVTGYRKLIIWIAAWCVVLGTGLGKGYGFINFAYPLSIYLCSHSLADYQKCVEELYGTILGLLKKFSFIKRWTTAH